MKGYLLTVWSLIDPFYFYFSRLTYPPFVDKKENILRIRLTKYKGREVTLSDGTRIKKNDILVKIHLHNVRLLKELRGVKSELNKTKMILNYVRSSLPGVESFIRMNPHTQEIKGILGITSRAKGSERLGFEVFDIMHPVYRWFKTFAFLPISYVSSRGIGLKELVKFHKPKYLFMSAKKLTELYGNGAASEIYKLNAQLGENQSGSRKCL